jgi:hypothetical protein
MKSFPLIALCVLVVAVMLLTWPSEKVKISCPSVESYCVAFAEAPSDFGRVISFTGQKTIQNFAVPDPHGYLHLTLRYSTPTGETKTQKYYYQKSLLDRASPSSVSGVRYAYARDRKGNIVASADIADIR